MVSFSKLGAFSFVYDNVFVQQKTASDKQAPSKQRIPQSVTSPMDYEFDDSLQNFEPQAQKPKRPKRPTMSANENLQPAFTGTPMAGLEQTHYQPVNELGSGGFRVGQDHSIATCLVDSSMKYRRFYIH